MYFIYAFIYFIHALYSCICVHVFLNHVLYSCIFNNVLYSCILFVYFVFIYYIKVFCSRILFICIQFFPRVFYAHVSSSAIIDFFITNQSERCNYKTNSFWFKKIQDLISLRVPVEKYQFDKIAITSLKVNKMRELIHLRVVACCCV